MSLNNNKIPKSVKKIKQAFKNTNILRKPLESDIIDKCYNNQEIIFQCISWHGSDFEDSELEETLINNNLNKLPTNKFVKTEKTRQNSFEDVEKLSYQIYVTGNTMSSDSDLNHKSICLRIKNFKPFFYVELPKSVAPNKFVDDVKEKLWIKVGSSFKKISYGIESYSIEKKMKLYPFLAKEKFNFVKLSFHNMLTFNRTKAVIKKNFEYAKLFESQVDPINRFCHVQNISTTGYVIIKNYEIESDTSCQLSITTDYTNITHYECNIISNITILSWDIECQSENLEDFPNENIDACFIGQIGFTIYNCNNKQKIKGLVSRKPCSDIDNCIIISCETEKELLLTFSTLVELIDPDFVIGYNTWAFDDKYLYTRMNKFITDKHINKFSRIKKIPVKLEKKMMSSGAYGDNEYLFINMPGRITLDVYPYIRREHKLESYSLGNVGTKFIGETKKDLLPTELFKILDSDNPNEQAIVADYCIQDTNLVIELTLNQVIINNLIEMAKTTYVPIDWLLFRGQQCKAFSLIVKYANENNIIVPEKMPMNEEGFEGATVRTPNPVCLYEPVSALDFAGLYPSIIRAHNLCYTTLVVDDKYKNLPNYDYFTMKWTSDNRTHEHTFVQNTKEGYDGILPTILTKLAIGRKETKKLMKNAKTENEYQVLNSKQLSQKVTANSIYGFTGTGKQGILPCVEIASTITACGRSMIEETGKLAQDFYSSEIIYGDSIPEFEEVFIGFDNNNFKKIMIADIDKKLLLEYKWSDYRFFKTLKNEKLYYKEQLDLEEHNINIYTKTGNGASKIKRIIRHKAPNKKLFRITVKDNNGLSRTVIVTEGHSLIDNSGSLIKAEDIKKGSLLMNC